MGPNGRDSSQLPVALCRTSNEELPSSKSSRWKFCTLVALDPPTDDALSIACPYVYVIPSAMPFCCRFCKLTTSELACDPATDVSYKNGATPGVVTPAGVLFGDPSTSNPLPFAPLYPMLNTIPIGNVRWIFTLYACTIPSR